MNGSSSAWLWVMTSICFCSMWNKPFDLLLSLGFYLHLPRVQPCSKHTTAGLGAGSCGSLTRWSFLGFLCVPAWLQPEGLLRNEAGRRKNSLVMGNFKPGLIFGQIIVGHGSLEIGKVLNVCQESGQVWAAEGQKENLMVPYCHLVVGIKTLRAPELLFWIWLLKWLFYSYK